MVLLSPSNDSDAANEVEIVFMLNGLELDGLHGNHGQVFDEPDFFL